MKKKKIKLKKKKKKIPQGKKKRIIKTKKKLSHRKKKRARKIKKNFYQRKKSKSKKFKVITSSIKLKKIKLPNINKQIKKFKKISFIKILERTFKILDKAVEEAADIISKPIKSLKKYGQQRRIEKLKKINIAYKEKEKEIKFREKLREELLKKELKEEEKNVKKLEKELQEVLKKEQKIIRISEKEKQKKFNEQLRIEKQLNKFKEREIREIQTLQKISLQQEKSEWKNFQDKIDSIKRRYQLLRNERVKQRVEELAGTAFSDQISIEEIRTKEKEILENKELITSTLEPFYRSIKSVLHTINLRYLPKQADLLILEDLRYEESEIIVREDSQTENFLILVYLENNDPLGKIIVENKCNEEKYTTSAYSKKDIFKFGDDLIDSVIFYIQRIRQKNKKAS